MYNEFSDLSGRFGELPLSAQLFFLSACTETAAVLMISRSPGALGGALTGDSNWMEISKFTDLVDRHIFRPKVGDIPHLAERRDRMDELESEAKFHGRFSAPAALASQLAECAIEPTSERTMCCYQAAFGLMIGQCEHTPAASAVFHRTFSFHLEQLERRVSASNDGSLSFFFMRPFWRFGKPAGWPGEGLWLCANALTRFVGKGGLGHLAKVFK
jgi:hypothetical protein